MNTTELVFEIRPEKNSGPEFVSSPQCTYMILWDLLTGWASGLRILALKCVSAQSSIQVFLALKGTKFPAILSRDSIESR